MGKSRERQVRERKIRWHEQFLSIADRTVDFLMIVFTVLSTFQSINTDEQRTGMHYFLAVLAIVLVVAKAIFGITHWLDNGKYAGIRKAEDLSSSTLMAFNEAHTLKRRCILQSTYGRVPKWHPTDYTQNVLVYDVHEQIRSILYGLQKLIVDTTEGMSEDQVTVDLVYCYPKEKNSEDAFDSQMHSQNRDGRWRIITSGNHSLGGSIHSYLDNKGSFYHHVEDCGYSFYNDKSECIEAGHYIISDKDKEQTNRGSIVGLKMELKNDEPEAVFLKAILTITTYGKKLYEKGPIKQKVYEEIFKENVINSYRSLLLSELSQMYIRHAILEGNMCPRTGQLYNEVKKKDSGDVKERKFKTCKRTGKECKFCNYQGCSCERFNQNQ